jgi:hypothetical protein
LRGIIFFISADECWALGTNGQGGGGAQWAPTGEVIFFCWAAQRMEQKKKESTYGGRWARAVGGPIISTLTHCIPSSVNFAIVIKLVNIMKIYRQTSNLNPSYLFENVTLVYPYFDGTPSEEFCVFSCKNTEACKHYVFI